MQTTIHHRQTRSTTVNVFTIALLLTLVTSCVVAKEDDEEDKKRSDGVLGEATQELSGGFAVGTPLRTTADVNHREQPARESDVLQVIPANTIVRSASSSPVAGWYGVSWNGRTGWVDGKFLSSSIAGGAGRSTASLAGAILAYHRSGDIVLWNQTFGQFDGADPLSNMSDAAESRRAFTSCYGTAPCDSVALLRSLLLGMVSLRERYGFRYFVTAVTGGSHSFGSYHYDGRAFDVDEINGSRINGDTAVTRSFMSACRSLGAVEVLGPSNRADHQDHVHCAW